MDKKYWKNYINKKNRYKYGASMKVSEFLGKPVLDKNASEIGKVSDMFIKPKEGLITSFTVSSSDLILRKKEFEFEIDKIAEIGDYILLNVATAELKEVESESKEE